MSLTDEQRSQLNAALDESRVKQVSTGGRAADYLETYDIIDAANRIFGYDGWSFELIDVSPIHAATKDGEGRGVLFMAKGKLTVAGVSRIDVGTNDVSYRRDSGEATPDSFETAIKGAVSDCLKRCFRTFGSQFGNSLYDKQRRRPPQQRTPQQARPAQPRQQAQGAAPKQAPNDNGAKFAALVKDSKLSGSAILEIAGVESLNEITDWNALTEKVAQFKRGEPINAE